MLAATASITLVALALAACTGAPAPSPATSTSPSPAVSFTPRYEPADDKGKAQNVPLPVVPAAAKAHTKEGLQAFMKHWVGLLSYAYETGNTGPLFEVTGPNCASCNGTKSVVDDGFAKGGWMSGGQVELVGSETEMATNKFDQTFGSFQMRQKPMTFLDPRGKIRSSPQADDTLTFVFYVSKQTSGWQLDDFGNAGQAGKK